MEHGYNGHVRSVNVAKLKNQLSAYLHRVRGGEELLIRDRDLPIAKIVPLRDEDMDFDERSLVASGQMTLPKKAFREGRFWSIGGSSRADRKVEKAIQKAVKAEREDKDVSLLGHKRHHSPLRSRPSK